MRFLFCIVFKVQRRSGGQPRESACVSYQTSAGKSTLFLQVFSLFLELFGKDEHPWRVMPGMFDLFAERSEMPQKLMFEIQKTAEKSSKNLKKGVDFSNGW